MNNNEKIAEIKIILDNYEEKKCPYCGADLVPFLSGIKKKFGCRDGHESLEIREIDYVHAIGNIVRFSAPIIKDKFKQLTEF